jgi:hypothetical protein
MEGCRDGFADRRGIKVEHRQSLDQHSKRGILVEALTK